MDSNYRIIKTKPRPIRMQVAEDHVNVLARSAARHPEPHPPSPSSLFRELKHLKNAHNVLPAMPSARAANTETHKSGANGDARNVYRAVPGRILPGAEALHNL